MQSQEATAVPTITTTTNADEVQARLAGWKNFEDAEDPTLLVVAHDDRKFHFTGPNAWAEALVYEHLRVRYVKFPNGKVWPMTDDGRISGTVRMTANPAELEDWMDQLSEDVTGSPAGLSNFGYTKLGQYVVQFSGHADAYANRFDDETQDEFAILTCSSLHLGQALAKQHELSPAEIVHVMANLLNKYGDECTIRLHDSPRALRCPAYPAACSYVRVTIDELELAYWTTDELGEAPVEVMGAILGAARGP